MQGDIIAIVSGNKLVAEYEYDAWGNFTILRNTNNIANTNPLRYRGYYYDTGTNLYYLQSRYYDANIGRFINADDVLYTGVSDEILSNNIYAYCNNDCINATDQHGDKTWHRRKRLKGRLRNSFDLWVNLPTQIGAQEYLRKRKGWKYSAQFLEHSLKKKPSDLKYYNSSQLAKDLKKTKEIRNEVNKFAKSGKSSKTVKGFAFKSGDFFGAFYHVNLNLYQNKKGDIIVWFEDVYDFKMEWAYSGKWVTIFANNYAYVSQVLGSLHTYKIYVKMVF